MHLVMHLVMHLWAHLSVHLVVVDGVLPVVPIAMHF
jgi:hypothetical protein